MNVILNGEKYSHPGQGTILSLLKEVGAGEINAAVVVNEEIVPKADHNSYMLKDGDQVEILTFAEGG